MKKFLPIFLQFPLYFLFSSSAFASENMPLDQALNSWSVKVVVATSLFIAFVFLIIFLTKNRESLKKYFFLAIVIPVLMTSLFLVGATLYVNQVSSTKGPVHWHADFEIYDCGQKIDLVDPTGFSNKIGTATFHEHNDGRLHVEGVVLEKEDVNFGSFINVIGGKITEDSLQLPTTKGSLDRSDGDTCSDGTVGEWQVFLYSVNGKNVGREKLSLDQLQHHVLAPSGSVPPGDCIILEFTESKSKTDHLCTFYKTAIKQGKFNY